MSLDSRARYILFSFFLIVLVLLIAPGAAAAGTTPPGAKGVDTSITTEQGFPTAVMPAPPAADTRHKPAVISDADGAFRFEGLDRGTHQVYLDPSTLPVHLRSDMDAPPVILWLNPGQSLISEPLGAGVRLSATYDANGTDISGVVFFDRDGDGRQGAGEPGLAGVTVIDPTIHQYFIPFDDRDLIAMLSDSNDCQPSPDAVGDFLASRISLTASSDNTTYYYDHWEDGYDPNPLNPGRSTLVGVLNAGETQIFEDEVNTADPDWGTTLYYDGRDRITVLGEPASVIRGASPSLVDSPIGTRLAGAWEIDEVANWGTEYVIPAGEDWGPGSDFEFTGASITVLRNGTQISLDGAPRGTPLNVGETEFIPGDPFDISGEGLDSGDRITATGPIQVHAYSSICTVTGGTWWSGNGYTLEPRGQWASDYWSPVPNRTAGPTCSNSADLDIFLYNDTGAPFDITIDDGTPNTVPLPTGTSSVVALNGGPLSDVQGTHIRAPGGEQFWGIANFDSGNTAHEWGYSLVPVDELSSQVVLGWAPGNDNPVPATQFPPSGNLAFVTPVNDTTIFADFDQNGTPDPMDCNGDGDANDLGVDGICDEPTSAGGVAVTQGQTLRVSDPGDADLTGALIYTTDLTQKFAVAWGQDSCVAQPPLPYLDMGYTVLPIAVPSVSKFDALARDVDQSGDISVGDILTYTIIIANNGLGAMNNVIMTDVLPYTYTDFIVGSVLAVSTPPPLPAPGEDYFDGTSWGYTPTPSGTFGVDAAVQQLRLNWPTINGRQSVTVTFRVRIQQDVPPDVMEISNLALVSSDQTRPRRSEDPDDPTDPDTDTRLGQPILWLNKLPSDPSIVAPGETLTYTIVVSNVGTATALSALVVDNLPPWLTYVPNTLDLTWPVARVITTTTPVTYISTFRQTYGDNFDNAARTETTLWGGNDGTRAWNGDWAEFNDDGSPIAGDIIVLGPPALPTAQANTPPGYLWINDASGNGDSWLERCADLTDFVAPHLSYQLRGASGAGDLYRVDVNGVTIYTEQYNNDGPYVNRDIDLSAYGGNPNVCIAFVGDVSMEGLPDFYRIDDVFIYENSPTRSRVVDEIQETTVINYSTRTNINPVTYTRILPDPFTPAITHTMTITNAFPFPPQSRVTATFQVRVGYPLTDGLEMINTASITATNLFTTPYPLRDDEPTRVQSSHVLTITKSDEPDPVMPGQLLTYGLLWEVAGDEPAPGVVVTDNLPLPYVSFVSCAPLPACQGETSAGSGVVTWDLGDRLPPMSGIVYDSGHLTVTVRVDQRPPGGVFTNTVIIDDETDTPPDEDDEPTTVPEASYLLSKRRITPSPVTVGEDVDYLIAITNTGIFTITRLPLTDTYDPVYLGYRDALPVPDNVTPGLLTWNDLAADLPGSVLPPGESVQVWTRFEALTSTQELDPPVTVNTARSEGALTDAGELPPLEDDAEVGIRRDGTTAIELLYFRANPKAGGVLVEWATLFEIDTYGFWLYRGADAEFGHAERVAFVPSKGMFGLGAAYQYLDAGLPGGKYYYWLVEIENSGQETAYGPVSAWSGWDTADLPYRIYLPLIR